MSKYGNRKSVYKGEAFDSILELTRYKQLELLQQAKEIAGLIRQVKFELIPKGKRGDGKTERACVYVADFMYTTKDGRLIVEDSKGMKTRDYIIKRKLMLKVHGITIKET